MEEKENLTAERSLEIIRDMMERSKNTTVKHSAAPLVWWGLLVAVFALVINFLWKHYNDPGWNLLWFVMGVIGYIGNRMIDKRRESMPKTFVNETVGHVWCTFGIFCAAIGFTVCFIGMGVLPIELISPDGNFALNLTSIITLCLGIASTITGFVLHNRTILICGIIAGIGGFFGAMRFPEQQMYVMAAVAIVGLVIPGLIISIQSKK
ncbi:MAG: hypothetical protein IKX36_05405 [Prevotella sp.]|nr:hypothetical protein [Prevotella sp.]